MNDQETIDYLERNAELVSELEFKALKNCNLPKDYLYVDGNLNDGFSVLLGSAGKGASQSDIDNFHANFMSLLKSHLREL